MTTEPSLFVSAPDSRLIELVRSVPDPGFSWDEVELLEWDLRGSPPRDEIDMVVIGYIGAGLPVGHVDQVSTRLVQSQSIGYEHIVTQLPTGYRLANAATVHEAATSELAVGLIIASQRGIDSFVREQEANRWGREASPWRSVADSTVLLLGYGGVGRAVESRLAGFELGRIIRVASHARDETGATGETVHVHGFDELAALLREADIVVVAVPLTEATHGLLSARLLAQLHDDALVVNVARGGVADTEAILAEAGRLRFGLDVTDPEPLPDGHPLFSAPGVLITPHVGGATPAMNPRVARLIVRQIGHLLRGEEPENIVN